MNIQTKLQSKNYDYDQVRCFNTYLTIFSINLVHRFPDVTDLTGVDEKVVRNIAELSLVSTSIALETWGVTEDRQRQRSAA